jgi:hypothetical protein
VSVNADGKGLSMDLFGNDCRLEHWHGDLHGAVPKNQVTQSLYDSIYVNFTAGCASPRQNMMISAIRALRNVA